MAHRLPGEEIEDTSAGYRVAVAVGENIEERLAEAIGARADIVRARGGERPPPELTADDPHGAALAAVAACR